MTDRQRDLLLRRLAAHQYRMGQAVLFILEQSAPLGFARCHEDPKQKLGEQNHWLSRAIEESCE